MDAETLNDLHKLFQSVENQADWKVALDTLLANPERGSDLLQALSKVDIEVINSLRQLGAKDRNLLMALLKGM